MNKLLKKIKLFWSESQPRIVQSDNGTASFHVMLRNMEVGTLEYNQGIWIFKYSEEFINQKEIVPLANFPCKDKSYSTKDLWPFFASRIPSSAQLQTKETNTDVVQMLSKYGRRTIANPYELCIVK